MKINSLIYILFFIHGVTYLICPLYADSTKIKLLQQQSAQLNKKVKTINENINKDKNSYRNYLEKTILLNIKISQLSQEKENLQNIIQNNYKKLQKYAEQQYKIKHILKLTSIHLNTSLNMFHKIITVQNYTYVNNLYDKNLQAKYLQYYIIQCQHNLKLFTKKLQQLELIIKNMIISNNNLLQNKNNLHKIAQLLNIQIKEMQKLSQQYKNKIKKEHISLIKYKNDLITVDNIINKLHPVIFHTKQKKYNLSKANKKNFSNIKDKIMWPFKVNKNNIIRENKGVFITASKHTAVHPAANGRIIFANMIHGLGKVIIINHNNGLMTLYGNVSIMKHNVGELVTTKDILAYTGNNVLYKRHGLYFSIRHNQKAKNPLQWCYG